MPDIAQQRLANQRISHSACKNPGEVVAWLCAMQAQDYLGALWSVGLRLPGATQTAIEQALADRTIVRTWPMRGTLHLVAATDVRWMLELLTPRIIAGSAGRHKQLGLDDATFAAGKEVIVMALQGDKQLTRNALYELLEAAHISTAGQRGYHILGYLAQTGVICLGAHEGKQPTFALLEEWAPNAKRMDRDEALAELAKRYFTGHGPATLQDFVWWTGLKVADARAGLESVASQLASDEIDGKTYWMSHATPPDAPSLYLLPGFDEYLLGYTDRSAALDPQYARKVHPGGNGMFSPTIVINGRVAGVWRRTLKKKEVVITASLFAALNEAEHQALAAAADQYGKYLGLSAVVQVTGASYGDGAT
jgi:hypothetical protein